MNKHTGFVTVSTIRLRVKKTQEYQILPQVLAFKLSLRCAMHPRGEVNKRALENLTILLMITCTNSPDNAKNFNLMDDLNRRKMFIEESVLS